MCFLKIIFRNNVSSYEYQSWARDNRIASQQIQRDNLIEPQGPEKILKNI